MKEQTKGKAELFFPYYVNQGRLLDIYAILNGGYSEYAEISTEVSKEKSKSGKFESNISGGFKLFNFGATVSADADQKASEGSESKEKKVQTVTSILSIVKESLQTKGYLIEDLSNSKAGDFVLLPVVLEINSIKSLLTEMSELLKLTKTMEQLKVPVKGAQMDIKKVDDVLKAVQVLFGGEEVFFETETYAIIGNISDSNLYQSIRADIIGSELKCLAQVRRVYPQGTGLMKNTIFTKIKDTSAKQKLIDAFSPLIDGNVFEFEATAIPSVENKPVYQLEIIALYQ